MSTVFSPVVGETVEFMWATGWRAGKVIDVPSGTYARYRIEPLGSPGAVHDRLITELRPLPVATAGVVVATGTTVAGPSNDFMRTAVAGGGATLTPLLPGQTIVIGGGTAAAGTLMGQPVIHAEAVMTSAPIVAAMRERERETGIPASIDAHELGSAGAALMSEASRRRFAGTSREALFATILDGISGIGAVDVETPRRFLRALDQLTEGYAYDQAGLVKLLRCFPVEGGRVDSGMVTVDAPFASLCEHHVLPFSGTVSVAYVPKAKIVGLSKIPRLVRAVSRRLQVQERIGQMVGDTLMAALEPMGVMVVVRARHSCMALRGAESPGEMATSYVTGCFRDEASARAEALELFRRKE